jgi:hypothetical protein
MAEMRPALRLVPTAEALVDHLETLLRFAAIAGGEYARALEYHDRTDLDDLVAAARRRLMLQALVAAGLDGAELNAAVDAVLAVGDVDVLAAAAGRLIARSTMPGAAPRSVRG